MDQEGVGQQEVDQEEEDQEDPVKSRFLYESLRYRYETLLGMFLLPIP